MEIKVVKSFAVHTDIEALDDHKKVFLAVVSAIYRTLDLDHYVFFQCNDLELMTGLRRFDPTQRWNQNNEYGDFTWFYDCFEYVFHNYQNLGIRPKKHAGFWHKRFGKPTESTTITRPDAQRMYLYLMGRMHTQNVVSNFEFREMDMGNNAWTLDRDMISWFNKKWDKKDLTINDEGPMG